jgi:hypothetical protein
MEIAFFKEMAAANTILLAGAGGGYDVYAGLPLYFWLRRMGKTVHLANLSFVNFADCPGGRQGPGIMRVTTATRGPTEYFPELALSEWLSGQGVHDPVYAIEKSGVQGVARSYGWLVEELKPDTVVLIDGGTDILMRGDEPALGTAEEDISSLLAVQLVSAQRKFVCCLGFGVDTFHGVCHALVLENMAALIEGGGYLGAWSLTREMEEAQLYAQAVEHARQRFPYSPSIVNHSIVSAAQGWFGDRHFSDRTAGSKLFLNPLMALYWTFQLEALADRLMYREQVLATETWHQLAWAIEAYRDRLPERREWTDIPH